MGGAPRAPTRAAARSRRADRAARSTRTKHPTLIRAAAHALAIALTRIVRIVQGMFRRLIADRSVPMLCLVCLGCLVCAACRKPKGDDPRAESPVIVRAPSTTAPGAPRAGMVWIPAGVLRAGSAPREVPRIAEQELPGVDVPMGGYYIDVLPWPNEVGAIPTTGITRDDAARLCEGKSKRLCSELEWERACKGPSNTPYEYGATYDARLCDADTPVDLAARRPAGERLGCKSAFGVRDMHGGAWEWTDSRWTRGARTPDAGVVRGGTDSAGDVWSRCAAARPVAPTHGSPTIGFRCCAGPRNDAEVDLHITGGPHFERTPKPTQPSPPLEALGGERCGPPGHAAPCFLARAWTWRPVANVVLSVAGGCDGKDPNARCGLAVSTTEGDPASTLAQIDTGRESPEVVEVDVPNRRFRVRGGDGLGPYVREVSFEYGRVSVRMIRRHAR